VTVYYLPGTTGWGSTFSGRPAVLRDPAVPFNYTTNGGAITITGYWGTNGVVTIPGTIIGLPVTRIGTYAFYAYTNLTRVILPSGLTTIGDAAFLLCENLTNVAIPASVSSVGNGAFAASGLTSLTLSNGLSSIGDQAFHGCARLTSVTIPASVASIGAEAFSSCASLTSIAVEASNPYYRSVAGVLFNQTATTLIQCPGGKMGAYAVPDGVTAIGNAAFSHCYGLTAVTMPNGLASIGGGAFNWCTSLPSLTIPSSVTSIGVGAFSWCTNLTALRFRGNAPSAGSDVFYADDRATVYYLPGKTGWGATFGGRPTALWRPQALMSGVFGGQFGFTIDWAAGQTVVVESCASLATPGWSPIATNTLSSDVTTFNDSRWTNYNQQFYRLPSP